MATFGLSTSSDAVAVERLLQGVRIAKQTRLSDRLFQQSVPYTRAPDASSIVRSVALSKPLLSLFAECQVTKPRTLTLKVRRIVAE